MCGRVKNTDIFANSNYQVLLNKDHPISKLIIQDYHEGNLHIGGEQTLSNLLQNIGYLHATELFVQ